MVHVTFQELAGPGTDGMVNQARSRGRRLSEVGIAREEEKVHHIDQTGDQLIACGDSKTCTSPLVQPESP